MCACLFVSMQFQPLLWVCLADCNNGCILFSQGSRLQAPGGQETVNKPQLAASPGVTQQPGCVFFFFFFWWHGVRTVDEAECDNRFWKRRNCVCVCLCVIMQQDWPRGGCASGAVVPRGPWWPHPQSPSAPPAAGLCSAPGCLWSSPSSEGAAEMQLDLRAQTNPHKTESALICALDQ